MSGKAERPHNSSLITHHLILIIVIVIVVIFFFDDVQFNWIQSDDLEMDSTLFAIHRLAFVHIRIHVNFGFTFWARSGRHLITSSYLAALAAPSIYVKPSI
jgi:hypothetical protein